jgi:HD-GYP domain-containing protein (c-di-GMP phosphodiesterase class II)
VTVFRDPSEDDRVWALFNRCAQLAADAATRLGFADGAILTLRRAALVHEFGTTAIPNSIWDKPGPLTRAEFDRVELHPMLTEQMLRRSPALAVLNPAAEPRCCAWRRGV